MDKIAVLLTRGVDKIYPSKEALEKVLRAGKKLKLYQGFDPTGTQLHIGHMVALRKLRQWQDLGHEVIFLIGDGTGQAGDPSGKTKAREKFLSRDELRANARDYVKQASKIVRFNRPNPVKILYNGDWLNKLTLVDILKIAQHFSVQELIERDIFDQRMKRGESINLREFLYPLLQAYDSVAMDVDLELGGTDQTFNMLAGRKLVSEMLNKQKFVMTVPLLTDSKGVKIGKTEGNVIGITDSPNELFGKIMALGDDVITPGFTLLTDIKIEKISGIKDADNLMNLKKELAFRIVSNLHSQKDANEARGNFEKTFQEGHPEYKLRIPIRDTLAATIAPYTSHESISDAKRMIHQGGVDINDQTMSDPSYKPRIGDKIKIGQKTFGTVVKK